MDRAFWSLRISLLVVTCVGCRAQQLQQDQDQFRHALLELYTDQIMDNLIRSKNDLPIVQLDYKSITGTITQDKAGGLSGSRTNDAGAISRVLGFSAGASQNVQLTVSADPVLNDPGLYDAYRQFALDDELLKESCDPPPCGAAHIVRRFGTTHYWVPVEHKAKFYELALKTTILRGEPVAPPEGYTVTVEGALDVPLVGLPRPDKSVQYQFTLKFKGKLPNGEGYFIAPLDGGLYKIHVYPVNKIDGRDLKLGDWTDRLHLRYTKGDDRENDQIPIDPSEVTKQLQGQIVTVIIPDNPPAASSAKQPLEELEHQMTLFRLNQKGR